MAQPRPQHRDVRLINAIRKWRALKTDDRTYFSIDEMMEFGLLIGHPHNPRADNYKIIDTDDPEVNRIVDLILSENGYAILKMLEVRYNVKTSSEEVYDGSIK